MFVRIVHFNLAAGSRAAAQGIADKVVPVIRAQPGCQRAEFFGDEATGGYGVLAIWATKQDAGLAAGNVSPVLTQALAEAGATDETRQLYEVIEPQTAG